MKKLTPLRCAPVSRVSNKWLFALFAVVLVATALNFLFFRDCGCW
ncbi:hypothetical protein [Fundidesulfovibrio magnetotacticus]|nr:hypothetical protein [Fundidesulfovibrio magnetotacticus]